MSSSATIGIFSTTASQKTPQKPLIGEIVPVCGALMRDRYFLRALTLYFLRAPHPWTHGRLDVK
jgi:hypothetical protein